MKRSILLVALALMAVSQVAANEYMYTPFVREGVKWVYYYVNEDGFYPADPILGKGKVYMNLEFKGDTVINGLTYKAMHKYYGDHINQQNDTIPIYLREEDKVVYGIIPDGDRYAYPDCPIGNYYSSIDVYDGNEFVLYDFKDPINYWSSIIYDGSSLYQYLNTDTIAIGNHMAKRYNGLWCNNDFKIIEGIGADTQMNGYTLYFFRLIGPFLPFFHLSQVIEDGQVIYTGILYEAEDYFTIDEVVTEQPRRVEDDNYYNPMGQAVGKDVPTTPGIYIHQGKKIVVR